MPDFLLMGQALLVSAVVGAVVLLLLAWPWRSPNALRWRLGWVLGSAAGFYAGCGVLGQWPRWPPLEDRDRLLGVLLPLTVAIEIVAAVLAETRGRLVLLPRLCLATAAAPILLYNSTYLADLSGPNTAEWTTTQAAVILSALVAASVLSWGALERLQRRTSARLAAVALTLTCLAAGLTVMLSSYLRGGQLGLPLAGALAGVTLAASVVPAQPHTSHSLGVGTIGLFALLVIGRFFGSLPTSVAACLLFAPLLAWLPELPGLRRRWPRVRAAAGVVLVVIPLLLVVWHARQQFQEKSATTSSPGEPSLEDYQTYRAPLSSAPGSRASDADHPGDSTPASPWNVPPP